MTNNKPLISVIIPTYNSQDFIEETINSVLVQTFHNFEIIAVDDESTDDTIKILNRLKEKDSRIKYYPIHFIFFSFLKTLKHEHP